jgi:hypothetical protein
MAAMTVSVDAAEWGLIRPGVSTTATVRAKYGAPTRVDRQKVDNYDTENWVYEEAQAPVGVQRMTVEYGLLHEGKYRPEVVRALRLEPKPGTFNRGVVTNGWAFPTAWAASTRTTSSSTARGWSSTSTRPAGTRS